MKCNLDGTDATGWPSGGIEYGGDGDDEAYDIKAVSSNSYIVAGMAGLGTDDVATNAQGDGDYWVFNINGTGTIITGRNKVYFGTNGNEGNDYARSIAIDCYSGEYIVSGFCKSCAPEGDNHSPLLLLKIPANLELRIQRLMDLMEQMKMIMVHTRLFKLNRPWMTALKEMDFYQLVFNILMFRTDVLVVNMIFGRLRQMMIWHRITVLMEDSTDV
jgi:hypothetical protein